MWNDIFTREDEIKIIRILEGEIDVDDDDTLYEKLYEYYMDEMPYGTMKGRDGDPYEWINDRLESDFGYLTEVTELTEKDLEND